jgi:hypothetical protein
LLQISQTSKFSNGTAASGDVADDKSSHSQVDCKLLRRETITFSTFDRMMEQPETTLKTTLPNSSERTSDTTTDVPAVERGSGDGMAALAARDRQPSITVLSKQVVDMAALTTASRQQTPQQGQLSLVEGQKEEQNLEPQQQTTAGIFLLVSVVISYLLDCIVL